MKLTTLTLDSHCVRSDGTPVPINADLFAFAFKDDDSTLVYCRGVNVALSVKETPEQVAALMAGPDQRYKLSECGNYLIDTLAEKKG